MTHADTFALDRWTPPPWDAVLDWLEDGLERIMLPALALVSACLLVVLATQQNAGVVAAQDACVMTAVEDARAFAAVLGDARPVPSSFARQWCGQG